MNEAIQRYWSRFNELRNRYTKRQQITAAAVFALVLAVIVGLTVWLTRPQYEVAFYNLAPEDAGVITERLQEMGIPYRLSSDGRSISVPRVHAAKAKVQLAAEVDSGNIDYGIFAQNLSLGMTEKQFGVLERSAIEGELEKLIRSIRGVANANVMITLPERSVWLTDQGGQSTAAVVLELEPGVQLGAEQLKSLYSLISKSVPNLPQENISIVDEKGMPLDAQAAGQGMSIGTVYEQQENIRLRFQQTLQQDIQRTLGTIYGPDNVIVQVFANLNFDQESRQEQLVEPVVGDEGLPISSQRIEESATGQGTGPGGVVGTGTEDIPRYVSEAGSSQGTYERLEETVNYEINRIVRDVVASPYRVEDLSISVMFQPLDPENVAEAEADRLRIQNMLTGLVSASLSHRLQTLDAADIQARIAVDYRTFNRDSAEAEQTGMWLALALGGLVVLLLVLGVLWWFRRRRAEQAELEMAVSETPEVEDLTLTIQESDEAKIRRQLEEVAKKDPEQFVQLLRNWLVE